MFDESLNIFSFIGFWSNNVTWIFFLFDFLDRFFVV